ncbi:sugar porter family MFS transporter [Shewanella surugensis]|uniref:Sugar porter family MFS transporter n=1 Tax=Shewanella surugensis TaxID=212020 RepID=A0ABT0LHY9_9GAMM|nr:sugar porter family MFS transporter [Shewanella surugensis]MCL1127313.1 sugar porter family MFS transporter [Shewanella surugensis]
MESSLQKNNRGFVILVASVAGLGGLLFGFDTGIIANVQGQLVAEFHFTTFEWSTIVSITVLGAFLGALLSGKATDMFGRKIMLLIISIGFVIGAVILSLAQGYYSLLLGRLLLGICIGIASFTVPLFISEISPKKIRGGLVLLNGIAITAGESISFLVGYFMYDISPHSWRLIFLTGVIPAILLFVGMLFMPKSPRWLAEKNRMKEVLFVLQKIRGHKEADVELKEIKKMVELEKNITKSTFEQLFSKKLRGVLIVGLFLGIAQQFAGINTIMYYGPYIFKVSGFTSETTAIFATFILGVVNTIGTIIVVFIVDKVGRRSLLISGTFVAFIALMFIGLCFQYNAIPSSFMMAAMIIYIFAYAISLGSMFWLIISEIYPTHIRGLAMSFVTAIQWLSNFVVAMAFLPLLNYFGGGITFWFFAVFCLVSCIYSYFYVPETKGVSLEQIEENLNDGVPVRYIGQGR